MNALGLRRLTRRWTALCPAVLLLPLLPLLLLLGACEEELAPQITKFDLDPTCDVISLHTAARLDEFGHPVLDGMGNAIIDTLGTYLDVRYFGRASGGNRLDDPTGTSGTLEYEWNFGDGSRVSGRDSGVHRYTVPGDYTVSLMVKDKDGQTASVSRNVLVGAEGTTVDVLRASIDTGHSIPSIASQTTGRLITFDISDPANPTEVDVDNLPGRGDDIDIESGFAYVTCGFQGVRIFDLASPGAPFSVATVTIPDSTGAGGLVDSANGIDVVGTTAYVATSGQLISRIDVTNPATPQVVVESNPIWLNVENLTLPGDLLVDGSNIVVANGFGLLVADYSDPDNPVLLGPGTLTSGFSVDLTHFGTKYLVADGAVGLQVFDLSNAVFPVNTGWLGTEGTVQSATFAPNGNTAYVADDLGGIHVVDLSGGGNPVVIGYVNTPGRAKEIELVNDRLIVANTGGVQIVDVSDPTAPTLMGGTLTRGDAVSLAVSGDYAYVVVNGNLGGWIGVLDGHIETPCPVSGLVAQYTWSWNFGDASAPQLHTSSPRHTFPPAPASYDVTLTVTEEQSRVSRDATLTIDIPEY